MELQLITIVAIILGVLAAAAGLGADSRDMFDDPRGSSSRVGLN
ncbi:MAG TPA: hypothetical protein VGM28_06035 [Candidatus Limnocylindrales bacterium]|jgi:hypothetical protein